MQSGTAYPGTLRVPGFLPSVPGLYEGFIGFWSGMAFGQRDAADAPAAARQCSLLERPDLVARGPGLGDVSDRRFDVSERCLVDDNLRQPPSARR